MNRHLLLALIVGLVAGSTALWWTHAASAQGAAVDYTLFVPDALKKDAIDGKIMVLRGGANIKEAIKITASAGGFFGFLDPDNKTGLYFFNSNEPGEIEVYRYLPTKKEFGLMDCANIWGDTETADVFNGIMASQSSFTVQDFLKYYDCKPVDSWFWLADDIPYFGEDVEPQAQAKKSNSQMEIAYPKTERVDFSGAATAAQAAVAKEDKGSTAALTPTQQELIISPGIKTVVVNANSGADFESKWDAVSDKLGTTQFVFTVNGKERYILDFWRFKAVEKKPAYEVGARLYLIENGKAVKTWDYATYAPALDIDAQELGSRQVLADSKTGILKLNSTTPLPRVVFSTSTGSNKNRGDVVLNLHIENNDTVKMSIDFKEDTIFDERTVIRFRLSDDTFQKIVKLPEFASYQNNKSKFYSDGKMTFTLVSVGEPDVTIAADANSTGQEPYFHSPIASKIKPGKYILKANLEGYKEITMDKIVNWEDLSTPIITTQLFVRELVIKNDFSKDYCTACKDVQSCLACVDTVIIASYEK